MACCYGLLLWLVVIVAVLFVVASHSIVVIIIRSSLIHIGLRTSSWYDTVDNGMIIIIMFLLMLFVVVVFWAQTDLKSFETLFCEEKFIRRQIAGQ